MQSDLLPVIERQRCLERNSTPLSLKRRQKERDRLKYLKNKEKKKEEYQMNKEKLRDKYRERKDARVFQDYERTIRAAPDEVCYSCDNLFFKRSIVNINTDHLHERLRNDIRDGKYQACSSCTTYIRRKEVPPMFPW